MVEARVERRLAAILAADVAGYSWLMGTDEEGTLRQLKAHRKELVDPKITEHAAISSRRPETACWVEFVSVVDAVRCAVDIQRGMVERNVEVPADKRIEFRVGINVGDIISDDNDIYGDGVNVAARLEALADPGGIMVHAMSTTRCAISLASVSRTWASRWSRILRVRSASIACKYRSLLRRP